MVTGAYRDLFVAIAGAAGALTGLLFVALSVAPRPRMAQHPNVIRQVRAAAALVAFTNALAVSLFGLVPNNLIGYPAAVAGVVGLLFALGGLRSILADPAARSRVRSQIGLILLLLAAFGVEIVAGVIAAADPHEKAPIDVIGNVLVASLLIGVARSWELVGDRDTGITASIAALAGHERHLGGSVAGPADVPRDDDAAWSLPGEAALAGGGSLARGRCSAGGSRRPSRTGMTGPGVSGIRKWGADVSGAGVPAQPAPPAGQPPGGAGHQQGRYRHREAGESGGPGQHVRPARITPARPGC